MSGCSRTGSHALDWLRLPFVHKAFRTSAGIHCQPHPTADSTALLVPCASTGTTPVVVVPLGMAAVVFMLVLFGISHAAVGGVLLAWVLWLARHKVRATPLPELSPGEMEQVTVPTGDPPQLAPFAARARSRRAAFRGHRLRFPRATHLR